MAGILAGFRRHRAGDRGLIAAPGPLLASLCSWTRRQAEVNHTTVPAPWTAKREPHAPPPRPLAEAANAAGSRTDRRP